MTDVNLETLMAELENLRSENEELKARDQGEITMKVSPKGGVSVYGLQRFPVTLYANQMERLLDAAPEIREFITENASQLARR